MSVNAGAGSKGTEGIMKGKLLCVAGATALLAAPALGDVKAGVDAWSRGDYAAAVRQWQKPAAEGDADAMFNLAQAYKLGRGVPADLKRAETLYAQAAARGHLQAADTYGLMLFERGERARAMPYITAAAGRGDPRAQYLLGIAHFNGENVDKDWVRAYALVSLAQQAGLPQAAAALAQMDPHIPLEDRQRSVALASDLAARAQATRRQQVAASELGTPARRGPDIAMGSPVAGHPAVDPAADAAVNARVRRSAGSAGADYARPTVPPVADIMAERPPVTVRQAPTTRAAPVAIKPPAPAAGAWRVQLGAFGVSANADTLWNRVRSRPELAGHGRINVPAGKVVKLQAGGFASQGEAQAACERLSAAGYTCLAVRD